jgi:hypothetical protein
VFTKSFYWILSLFIWIESTFLCYFFSNILIISSHLCLSVIRNEGHYMLFICYFHANLICWTHHHSGFDLPYIIRWWIQNTMPLILQYFLVSRHLRLGQCVLSTMVSNNLRLWFYFIFLWKVLFDAHINPNILHTFSYVGTQRKEVKVKTQIWRVESISRFASLCKLELLESLSVFDIQRTVNRDIFL